MIRLPSPLLVLALAACSQAPSPGIPTPNQPAYAGPTSEGVTIRLGEDVAPPSGTLAAPVERVWAALPVAYRTLGIGAQIQDSVRRAFGTHRFTERRVAGKATADVVRCGNQGAGPSAVAGYRIQLSIVSTLRIEAVDRTALTTEITGVAQSVDGTSTGRVRCVSTGELEHRIYQLVAAQLKE